MPINYNHISAFLDALAGIVFIPPVFENQPLYFCRWNNRTKRTQSVTLYNMPKTEKEIIDRVLSELA